METSPSERRYMQRKRREGTVDPLRGRERRTVVVELGSTSLGSPSSSTHTVHLPALNDLFPNKKTRNVETLQRQERRGVLDPARNSSSVHAKKSGQAWSRPDGFQSNLPWPPSKVRGWHRMVCGMPRTGQQFGSFRGTRETRVHEKIGDTWCAGLSCPLPRGEKTLPRKSR